MSHPRRRGQRWIVHPAVPSHDVVRSMFSRICPGPRSRPPSESGRQPAEYQQRPVAQQQVAHRRADLGGCSTASSAPRSAIVRRRRRSSSAPKAVPGSFCGRRARRPAGRFIASSARSPVALDAEADSLFGFVAQRCRAGRAYAKPLSSGRRHRGLAQMPLENWLGAGRGLLWPCSRLAAVAE